jgi:hypothetical protein
MTEEDHIIFTPTLLRISPLPIKMMSGALDDHRIGIGTLPGTRPAIINKVEQLMDGVQ